MKNRLWKNASKDIEDVRKVDGAGRFLGYLRFYFRNGSWICKWLDTPQNLNLSDKARVLLMKICDEIDNVWKWGCDKSMKEELQSNYPNWGAENKYLLEVIDSNISCYMLIDTTFGNDDYPIRIYVYEAEEQTTKEKIVEYIKGYIEEKGYAPSVREIGEGVGLKSTSTVHFHLSELFESGILETDEKEGTPRAIRLRDYEVVLVKKEN